MKHLIIAIFVFFTTLTTIEANVTVSTTSLQKIGKKWVKTQKVIPGTKVKYINTLTNQGSTDANNLVVVNAIPKEMNYVANSAKCKGKCSISYSVDGGKSYNSPRKLYITKGSRKVRAKAEDYTNIKWIVAKLNGSTQKSVEYSAILK